MSNVSPTWKWVAGVLVTCLLALGGLLYAQTQSRLDKLEDTKVPKVEVQDLRNRLNRIEDKLDRLLERGAR